MEVCERRGIEEDEENAARRVGRKSIKIKQGRSKDMKENLTCFSVNKRVVRIKLNGGL